MTYLQIPRVPYGADVLLPEPDDHPRVPELPAGHGPTATERAALARFNRLPVDEARDLLSACLDVPRWVDGVLAGRPFTDWDALVAAARTVAEPLTEAEVDRALAHHPRIGEGPSGHGRQAAMSRREQSGVDPADAEVARRLRAGNAAYERRFGHVFLIRAAGRSASEILAALEERLSHEPAEERRVVAQQLREIAEGRLVGSVDR